jgi:hypothetical protein
MITYKLLRFRVGHLYPLFVESKREMNLGEWLKARIGELADANHVKSQLGPLALRPGFHSCEVPFTDWIGKKQGSDLVQRKNTVWCECEVDGNEESLEDKNGKRTLPNDFYYFRTKPTQRFPWIISNRIYIKRILSYEEVQAICQKYGVEAQKMEDSAESFT